MNDKTWAQLPRNISPLEWCKDCRSQMYYYVSGEYKAPCIWCMPRGWWRRTIRHVGDVTITRQAFIKYRTIKGVYCS